MSCFVFFPLTSKKIPWQINLGGVKQSHFAMSTSGTWTGSDCWPRVIAGFFCLGILVFQKRVWGQGLC